MPEITIEQLDARLARFERIAREYPHPLSIEDARKAFERLEEAERLEKAAKPMRKKKGAKP